MSGPTDAGILRRRTHARGRKVGLKPLGFHEGRHTYASIGIAAGLNPKTLSTYLGHATITLDRYRHLMPGSEVEARAMLDAYLGKPEEAPSRQAASRHSERYPFLPISN